MVIFFDLSIPYLERDDILLAENKSRKDARLKSAVRAMELGYAAVAYDRPFRGVMSDSECCKIPPFPLSSLLRAAPALSSAASFRRGLLGTPLSSPFRQYSRLTVAVDSAAAASALNSGNPVLRTYDLVAARPLNQLAFDHACKVSEVDIISINFSQKLPFRLKLPMVEAAIERGVHFEITYSHLIADVHIRRQMLSDAKLLVDWTRGKNLIVSSAASTVNEIRGPYDVSNLSVFLLGLSMERAKAAISGNCRLLIANALRKKHCYKEAIRIERILPDEQAGFIDLNDWDPISSGEGDLPPLDDMVKFLSAACKVPKSSTAVDFMSVADGSKSKDNLLWPSHSATPFFFTREPGSYSAPPHEVPSASNNNVIQQDMVIEVPFEKKISMAVTPLAEQISGCEGDLVSPSDTATLFANAMEPCPATAHNEESESANDYNMVSDAAGSPSSNTTLENCIITGEANPIAPDVSLTHFSVVESVEPSNMCMEDDKNPEGPDISAATETRKDVTELVDGIPSDAGDRILLNNSEEFCPISMQKDMPEEQIREGFERELKDKALSANDVPFQKDFIKLTPSEQGEVPVPLRVIPLEDDFDDMKKQELREVVMVGTCAPLDEVLVQIEEKRENGSAIADGAEGCKGVSGKRRHKERSYPAYPLPFKALVDLPQSGTSDCCMEKVNPPLQAMISLGACWTLILSVRGPCPLSPVGDLALKGYCQ